MEETMTKTKHQLEVGRAFNKFIDDISATFREDRNGILEVNSTGMHWYLAQWMDSVERIAVVIYKWNPSHDMGKFYNDCGYTGNHPVHN